MNGEQFKQRRKAIGYRMRPQVAASVGVQPDTVKAWETDKRPVPKYAERWLIMREALSRTRLRRVEA